MREGGSQGQGKGKGKGKGSKVKTRQDKTRQDKTRQGKDKIKYTKNFLANISLVRAPWHAVWPVPMLTLNMYKNGKTTI